MAGIHATDEHIELYNKLKINKEYRCIIYGLNDARDEIKVFGTYGRDYTLEKLSQDLPANECRYVLYDFEFQTFENPPRDTSKLLLISWAPDYAPIKVKVPFAATISEIRSAFTGIQKLVEASDKSILDKEELRKECS